MNPGDYQSQLGAAMAVLLREFGSPPRSAIILGSGMAALFDQLHPLHALSFNQIPCFQEVTTEGQRGRLSLCEFNGVRFCVMEGRIHLYEGAGFDQVVLPVRTLGLWGVQVFLLANAAGAVKADFQPGDLMLISDHLNLMGGNPLVGPNLQVLGPRFPDMSEAYSRRLMALAYKAAGSIGMRLVQGVYAGVRGPCYETPAEIRMLRLLGADAVGMSTVPEVIALRQMNREVLGISCITNMAAGMLPVRLDHQEVVAIAGRSGETLARLLLEIVKGS